MTYHAREYIQDRVYSVYDKKSTRRFFLLVYLLYLYTPPKYSVLRIHTRLWNYVAGFCSSHLDFNCPSSLLLHGTGVVLEYMVHLFQAAAHGLWHEEERPDKGEQAKHRKEGVCTEACILH